MNADHQDGPASSNRLLRSATWYVAAILFCVGVGALVLGRALRW